MGFAHARQEKLNQAMGRHDVALEGGDEVILCGTKNRSGGRPAGVVDEHVKGAMAGHVVANALEEGRSAVQVSYDEARFARAVSSQIIDQPAEFVLSTSQNSHVESQFGEGQCGSAPDTLASAADEGVSILAEIEGHHETWLTKPLVIVNACPHRFVLSNIAQVR